MMQRWFQGSAALWLATTASVRAGSSLIDSSGNLQLGSLPDKLDGGVVALVSSPGTPSVLLEGDAADVLSFEAGTPSMLTCRGATLTDDETDSAALATSALVAGSIVLDGISAGDVEAGLRDSRHGRTLSAIFRARLGTDAPPTKQTLILPVMTGEEDVPEDKVVGEASALFAAAALECESSAKFGEAYEVKVLPYSDPEEIRSMVAESAASEQSIESFAEVLTAAHSKAKGMSTAAVASPASSLSMVLVGNVHSKHSHTVRAKVAAWKARVARGLLIDGFGSEAEDLLQRMLKMYDSETITGAAFAPVAVYRQRLRSQLQTLLESGIQEVFEGQIENLEKTTVKRLNAQLLKTMNEPDPTTKESNAAILRNEAFFAFESSAAELEVPTLGLTKTKVVREMSEKLNDALDGFEKSAAARIKRMNALKRGVRKDKTPGQRAFDLGLDLVAVLRPDGFGSLQGFAGYQLGGSSLTFGVHNDADDPQVIAQFGGVRPPLLRIQPKIRFDMEL